MKKSESTAALWLRGRTAADVAEKDTVFRIARWEGWAVAGGPVAIARARRGARDGCGGLPQEHPYKA
jgi:hypothetical protein